MNVPHGTPGHRHGVDCAFQGVKTAAEFDERVEAMLVEIRAKIGELGWYAVGVGQGRAEPAFTYSIGFWETWQHPEIVVTALPFQIGHALLARCAELVKDGVRLHDNATPEETERDDIANMPARFRAANWGISFGVSNRYYGAEVPRIQLVWPDPDGHFPGDPAMDRKMAAMQNIAR